ncbi:MAG: flagellar hook-length control protein FliK, partial [Sulfurimicrobium sp.]|nr:flagellar hook-length control protein FliK [Sulfurimicrobium sp.]
NQPRAAGEIKTPVGAVQPPVGASGWGDALGQKIVWMAGQHQQVAELHLNPPNLGPMEVRLTINNDQVSALFVSHQPAVREAIEAAMPRLREMFADSGMMLGNATVSSDSLPQHQNPGRERPSGSESRSDSPLVEGYSMPLTSRGTMPLHGDGRGLVDLFA